MKTGFFKLTTDSSDFCSLCFFKHSRHFWNYDEHVLNYVGLHGCEYQVKNYFLVAFSVTFIQLCFSHNIFLVHNCLKEYLQIVISSAAF